MYTNVLEEHTAFIFRAEVISVDSRQGMVLQIGGCTGFFFTPHNEISNRVSDFTSVGLLWTRLWIFGFHKRREISLLPERLSVSQEGLLHGFDILPGFPWLSYLWRWYIILHWYMCWITLSSAMRLGIVTFTSTRLFYNAPPPLRPRNMPGI
jgi:hypothetical protein